jgi:hypothetical protein
VEPQVPSNASGFLETPTSDLRTPCESLRSLFWVQLEMRFGGNPIEGSNPSLSVTPSLVEGHLTDVWYRPLVHSVFGTGWRFGWRLLGPHLVDRL